MAAKFAKLGVVILKNASREVLTNPNLSMSIPPVTQLVKGIQIVSDVHLEFRKKSGAPVIIPHAKNLALLGDIGKPFESSYRDFIETQAGQFEKVFVVMGNHEYYNSSNLTTDTILTKAREVCSEWNNVHLLERDQFPLDEHVTVLGCTLWSPLNLKTSHYLNDMNKIYVKQVNKKGKTKKKLLDVDTYFGWHVRDVSWLQKTLTEVADSGKKAVVLTHHGPLLDMSGKYKGNAYNSGFVSDLRHLFTPPAIAFASGHVHSNVDVTVNKVRSVSNALGYPGETTGYKEDVVLSLE